MKIFDTIKSKLSSKKPDKYKVETEEEFIPQELKVGESVSSVESEDNNFEIPFDFKPLELPENFNEIEKDIKMSKDETFDEEVLQDLENDILDENESLEFISNVSVYDKIDRSEFDVGDKLPKSTTIDLKIPFLSEYDSERIINKINSLSMKTFKIIIASALGVILIGIITLILSNNAIEKRNEQRQANFITQPTTSSNNTNFIYAGVIKKLNGENITISKLSADSLGTIFYFSKGLDVNKYNFSLTDSLNNIYLMDSSFEEVYKAGNSEKIYFQALDAKAKKFTLNMYDIETKENVDFIFQFDGIMQQSPARFIKEEKSSEDSFNSSNVNVYGGEFSSSSSKIFFTFNNKNTVFINDGTTSPITLKDSFGSVKALKQSPNLYTFTDGEEFQRFDFSPVTNIDKNIHITFNNLYKNFELQKDIDIQKLMKNTPEDEITIKVDDYNVTLERFGKQGDYYILVAHSENPNLLPDKTEKAETEKPRRITIPPTLSGKPVEEPVEKKVREKVEIPNPYANRIQINIDAKITGTTLDGKAIEIVGESNSMEIGTDILFPLSGESNPIQNLKLTLNGVSFKLPPEKITFNLSKVTEQTAKVKIAKENIKNAFESRLKYKSNEIDVNEVVGFSSELLNDAILMDNYLPKETAAKSSYNVNITAYKVYEQEVHAIVSEIWLGEEDGSQHYFYREHMIKAKDNGTTHTVYFDELIH